MRTVKLGKSMKKKKREKLVRRYESENIDLVDSTKDDSTEDDSYFYLMDSNLLLYILQGHTNILQKLQKHSNYKNKKTVFILLQSIEIQLSNLVELKIANNEIDLDRKDVKKIKAILEELTKKYGIVKSIPTPFGSTNVNWAKEFAVASENVYYNPRTGNPLGWKDCLLLKYYLDNPKYWLVTNDRPLKKAAKIEGDDKNRKTMIFDPIDSRRIEI